MWKEFIFGFLRLRKTAKKVSYVNRPPSCKEMHKTGIVLYIYRNIGARSSNHCCRGKTISITYSECVFFVALGA